LGIHRANESRWCDVFHGSRPQNDLAIW